MIFSTLPVRYKYSALLFLGLGIVVCSQICCKSPSASKNWSGAIQILREQRLVCILLCYSGVCATRLMLSIGEYGMLERACAKLNQYIFSTCARSTLLTLHSSANSSAAWDGGACEMKLPICSISAHGVPARARDLWPSTDLWHWPNGTSALFSVGQATVKLKHE